MFAFLLIWERRSGKGRENQGVGKSKGQGNLESQGAGKENVNRHPAVERI